MALAGVVVGAGTRIWWVLVAHRPFDYVYSDMEGYVSRATRLAGGGPLVRGDAFFPPGTHLLLSIPYAVFGNDRAGDWAAAALWALLSALVPLLGWRLAKRYLSDRSAALVGLVIGLWPVSVTYGGYFLSETPATVALLALLLALPARGVPELRKRRALVLGVTAGLVLAVRPQFGLNVVLIAVVLLARHAPRNALAVALLGLAIPVTATVAYNSAAAGRPVAFSENAGFNFFQGHCTARRVETGRPGSTSMVFASTVAVEHRRGRDYVFPDHLAWDQAFFVREGLGCIRREGLSHVKTVLVNVSDLGVTAVPWPQSTEHTTRTVVKLTNIAYASLLPSVLVFAAALAIRRRRVEPLLESPAALVAHVLVVLALAVVFYGDPRFRAPYDVLGLVLIAYLIERPWGAPRREPSGTT
ncbi:MAG: glycosyltransferase family 39 protein [Actinomycetota bacterium]|nr:glycosyltransferase family 39 protein [Actinomycetota bacterium]